MPNQTVPDAVKEAIRVSVIPWVPTLAEKGWDNLDFHSIAVWTLDRLIAEAYLRGKLDAERTFYLEKGN